jgi:hypothetical protein
LFFLIPLEGGGTNLEMKNLNRVKRAEMLLNKMTISQNCELTKEGANFVKQRFDPYHDLPMKPTGYPDSYNGSTVARCIKKTITVSATSSEGPVPSSTWNCHVFVTPIARPNVFTAVTGGNGNTLNFTRDVNTWEYGGIMIQRSNNDGPTWTYPQTAPENVLGILSLTNNDLKNVMRITSIGFEVIDETAELYKQGTLTAYRQNQQQTDPFLLKMHASAGSGVDTHNLFFYDGMATIIKKPPATTAAAMMTPDAKQWQAKEGAYVVVDFHDDDLPICEPNMIIPCLVNDAQDYPTPMNNAISHVQTPGANVSGYSFGITTTTPSVLWQQPVESNRILPINTSGVFLTGLNPQASFTINAIFYVECAPTGEDEELLSLCSQSPAYDPLALEIISKLRRDCPIAVKLRENYLGEWFFNGIKTVVDRALPWLSNAQVVAKQVGDWINTASTNDGYINPQSFVRGDVAKKIASEKNPTPQLAIVSGPPKAPGPAPMKKAYRPSTKVVDTLKGPNGKIGTRKGVKLSRSERKEMQRYRAAMAARGKYKSSRH